MKCLELSILLLACLVMNEANPLPFPWSRAFEGIPTPVFEEIPTTSAEIIVNQTSTNETSTTPSIMTTEPSNFWNRLYHQLKEIFQSVFPTANPIRITSDSTDEPFRTTDEQMMTESTGSETNQTLFKEFFASVANTFASIYNQFGSQFKNSSGDVISNFSPRQVFEDQIDILLQNHSLPVQNANVTEELKLSVVDALVSAWNESLQIDEIMVVNTEEIWDKILETLQDIQVEHQVNETEVVVTTERTSFALELDEFEANFMAILRQAEGQSNRDSGPTSRNNKNVQRGFGSGSNADWRDVLRIGNRGP